MFPNDVDIGVQRLIAFELVRVVLLKGSVYYYFLVGEIYQVIPCRIDCRY